MTLALDAYRRLIQFDLYLLRGDFAALYNKVRSCPVRIPSGRNEYMEQICSAVDIACIWYWKEVLCLQRSAATVCLLRKHGIPAHLIIGVQHVPFASHAWVEVDGRVVNDKPYITEAYAVLDRC
jgi:Transglutaminase-like superfamily